MESIVVDSSIIVSSFLESDNFHEIGRNYINLLENGDYVFYLPMLVVVEVMSAISRRTGQNRLPLMITWEQNIADWERDGKLMLYPLDRQRLNDALITAERYRLKGSDTIIAALAEELDLPLRTADGEMLDRLERASR